MHAGDALVVVVWQHTSQALARRLGIVYCYNRPCALHAVPAPPRPPPLLAAEQQGHDGAPGKAQTRPARQARLMRSLAVRDSFPVSHYGHQRSIHASASMSVAFAREVLGG